MEKVNKMTQIDTSKWGKFKVGELFDVANGKKYPSSIRQTGELPLISTTANNNGISDYIKDRNDGVYSNCITVAYSGSVGATFYHKEKVFVGETVIALLPKFKMNQYSGLFICSILSKINSKFSYTQKIKVLQYKNEAISLPVTPEGTPDFDYMEDYMKEITKLTTKRVEKLKEEKPQTKIDTSNWKKFKVGELFETVNNNDKQVPTGANVPSQELKSGTVPRISVTGVNNGVVGYFDSTHKNYKVYNNFISVNFLGNAFYQENNASLDMKVHCLKLKNKELNKYLALFLVTIINKLTTSYSYANQLSSTSITQLQLPLPITSEGTPDFDYMENYMKNIEDCTNNIIEQAKKRI